MNSPASTLTTVATPEVDKLEFSTTGGALALIERARFWIDRNLVLKDGANPGSPKISYVPAMPAGEVVLRAIAIQAARELRSLDPAAKLPERFVQAYRTTSEQVDKAGTPALCEVGALGITNGLDALETVLRSAPKDEVSA